MLAVSMTPRIPAAAKALTIASASNAAGLKKIRIFVSVSPFLIGERVDGKVQEGGGLEFVPAQLARRGNRARRRPAEGVAFGGGVF